MNIERLFSPDFFKWLLIPNISITDIIEIFLIVFAIYHLIRKLKDTRLWVITKGILILLGIYLVAYLCSFHAILILYKEILGLLVLGIIIIVQPELRKLLEDLGKRSILQELLYKLRFYKNNNAVCLMKYSDKTINEIISACDVLSASKTGALIALEDKIPLEEFISTGISIDSKISSQLLINIFEHNTPLHDGALIIQNDRINAATCYLPLSDNPKINKDLGTRHRAAIGISEVTDCMVIVVSEETGAVSFIKDGLISHDIPLKRLKEKLKKSQSNKANKKQSFKVKGFFSPKRFFRNIDRKIFAVLLGVSLWLMLINTYDPTISKTLSLPVSVVNENVINSLGQTYEIQSGDTVYVRVTGKKSIIDDITQDELQATANLSKMSYVFAVPIDIKVDSKYSDYIKADIVDNNVMILKLDEVSSLECPVDIEQIGKMPSGYTINTINSKPSTVKITGAKSKLNTIDVVKVIVDVSNLTRDGEFNKKFEIYDKNGALLDTNDFSIDYATIKIKVRLFKTKKVPLSVSFISNDPYCKIKKSSFEPKNIIISGKEVDLAKINDISISIPIENEDKNESIIKAINISDYLPTNIKLADTNDKLNVDVLFDLYKDKVLRLAKLDITILNKNDDYNYEILTDNLKIKVNGLLADLRDLSVERLNPYLDLSNLKDGEYNIPIQYSTLDNIKITENASLKIKITSK